MKTILTNTLITALLFVLLILNACKKDKNTPVPGVTLPPVPENTEEIITTIKLHLTDSASNVISIFGFEDIDGDGGNAGIYLGTNQADSVFTLAANKTYFMKIILLDKIKTPEDTISNEVKEEGEDHMFFFNQLNPTGTPFTTTLSGSGIKITYLDVDDGTPVRGIGLNTRVRTYASTGNIKNQFTITLRHQLGVKDGTFTPGETDVEIPFKVKVN